MISQQFHTDGFAQPFWQHSIIVNKSFKLKKHFTWQGHNNLLVYWIKGNHKLLYASLLWGINQNYAFLFKNCKKIKNSQQKFEFKNSTISNMD